jgi:hypothetical protein
VRQYGPRGRSIRHQQTWLLSGLAAAVGLMPVLWLISTGWMSIPSECRIASIGSNHAMIPTLRRESESDGIFGKDRYFGALSHGNPFSDLAR